MWRAPGPERLVPFSLSCVQCVKYLGPMSLHSNLPPALKHPVCTKGGHTLTNTLCIAACIQGGRDGTSLDPVIVRFVCSERGWERIRTSYFWVVLGPHANLLGVWEERFDFEHLAWFIVSGRFVLHSHKFVDNLFLYSKLAKTLLRKCVLCYYKLYFRKLHFVYV